VLTVFLVFFLVVPKTFLEALEVVKPTAIIGVSAQGGAFSKEVIERLTDMNEHPIIFALSNPTSKAECTALDAYTYSKGNCIFASGSPFDAVTLEDGRVFMPGQGNNAYIFPAFGLASIAIDSLTITDDDFIIAARSLANLVPEDKLAVGCCYPDLSNIREVSLQIAAAVAKNIYEHGRCELEVDKNILASYDWVEHCRKFMYSPSY
jgi:malic enzyme